MTITAQIPVSIWINCGLGSIIRAPKKGYAMRKTYPVLTEGERKILILVARGLTNQVIADELDMPLSKVKMHIHQCCVKLKANNRIDAVIIALKQKAIKIQEVYTIEELVDLVASIDPETVENIVMMLRERQEQDKSPAGQARSEVERISLRI